MALVLLGKQEKKYLPVPMGLGNLTPCYTALNISFFKEGSAYFIIIFVDIVHYHKGEETAGHIASAVRGRLRCVRELYLFFSF